jgi:hypothetical protein
MSENQIDVKPGFELEGLKGYMVFTYPSCGKNRHEATGLHPGSRVPCRCGKVTVVVAGDGLDRLQRGMDKLHSTLKSLGGTRKIRG